MSYKRDTTNIPHPFLYVRTQQEGASYELQKGVLPEHAHVGAMIMDIQPPEL